VVDEGTFSTVPTLQSINLSENNISSLPVGSFEFNNVGTSLYIWNSNISSIEPGAFVLPQTVGWSIS